MDTPGHTDFGGDVERVLGIVDGVLVLVDAAEGPMPQTKFVVGKALALGLRPIVVINKMDKPEARPAEVHEETFDLLAALDASDEQLDFPVLFTSAKEGWASTTAEQAPSGSGDIDAGNDSAGGVGMAPLFETVIAHVAPPQTASAGSDFCMLATILEADPFLGRVLTGRIESGTATRNMGLRALMRDGTVREEARATRLLAFRGLRREPVEEVRAGDIVAIAGFTEATVTDTICAPGIEMPLATQPIDPPTLSMRFSINDSPLAGHDGDKLTSRMIRQRLLAEAEGNVAIFVQELEDRSSFEVSGRGELQLAVLIEEMRREGYELSVGRPQVLLREDAETGAMSEPVEEVVIDVDDSFSGTVLEKLGQRHGDLIELRPLGAGRQRLRLLVPTRSLIGYHSEFLTDTRGTGVLHRVFHSYVVCRPVAGDRRAGAIISMGRGKSVAYALWNLEERGVLFIGPGEDVYPGMIIGRSSRSEILEVNPMRTKQLTNIRAAGKDDAVDLTPPERMTLEQAITFIAEDELVEVTPRAIRLRKRLLDPHERKRAAKRATAA